MPKIEHTPGSPVFKEANEPVLQHRARLEAIAEILGPLTPHVEVAQDGPELSLHHLEAARQHPDSPAKRESLIAVFDHFTDALLAISGPDHQPLDRLLNLQANQKERAQPIVRDIIGTLRELRFVGLSPDHAGQHLAELCVQLLHVIGLRPEETLEQFIQSLFHPEFMRRAVPLRLLDIEHMGTHEIKLHFKEFFTMLTGFLHKLPAHHLLGMFALFHAHPRLQTDVWSYGQSHLS